MFYKSYFEESLSGNCEVDSAQLLLEMYRSKSPKITNNLPLQAFSSKQMCSFLKEVNFAASSVNEKLLEENALVYMAGFLMKKFMLRHHCNNSNANLAVELTNETEIQCYFKAYDQRKSNFGELPVPIAPFIHYIQDLEQILTDTFSSTVEHNDTGKNILQTLQKVKCAPFCCKNFPKAYLLKLFTRMRRHYIVKFANREFKNKGVVGQSKQNRKYLKIEHL